MKRGANTSAGGLFTVKQKQSRYIYLLSAGHLCSDINQGALPAMLPFFIAQYHFSYAAAASLILAANIVSSVVQPLFGQLADKRSRPWVIAAGVLLAGCGMAATGFIPQFAGLCAAVMVSGVGVASYHPEAARLANKVSGSRKGTGISIFSFGGNLGFALGPILSTTAILIWGLRGTAVLAVPAIVMSAALFAQLRGLRRESEKLPASAGGAAAQPQPDRWVPFTLLSILMFGRSVVFHGLNTFLSLYWVDVLLQSESTGSAVLSAYFAVGAASTLLGGRLADRFGLHRVMRVGFLLLLPSLFALTRMQGAIPAALTLIPIAFSIYSPQSATIVLGQQYLPNRLGLASGVTLGLAVSVGGIAAPLLGRFADRFGLLSAMNLLTLLAIIPAVMSFTLPRLNNAE